VGHPQHQQGYREQERDTDIPLQNLKFGILAGVLDFSSSSSQGLMGSVTRLGWLGHGIPCLLDRLGESRWLHKARVEPNLGAFRSKVNLRLVNADHSTKRALYAPHTGRTSHAFDIQSQCNV
jgi:hypothetical protein